MLFEHYLESEEAARNRIDVIMSGLMKQYGITEELKAEKSDGVGAADERLQGTGRGSHKSGIDLQLRGEVRQKTVGLSLISQSCSRIVHQVLWYNLLNQS